MKEISEFCVKKIWEFGGKQIRETEAGLREKSGA
jgi:hypothetical protein